MLSQPVKADSSPPLIGRYRTLVKLGSGGMADVYLAVSKTTSGLEKLAVIKRLRPDLGEDPEEVAHFKGMFWDEARLAMLLNHANVVHTHDACEEGDALYIVMEYIEGQSLSNVQRELAKTGRSLTPTQCALTVSEVLAGLHYAHELKNLSGEQLSIVHRDVSPQNILLGYDGSIKLVDFGVAMASTRSTETRAGTLKGKARYMAPEQVVNKNVDRRSDVYSLGVVLWELIARRKMVAGANMIEQLVNVMKSEPERLSAVVPDVDPDLEAIVHKALARDQSLRYQTAQAMREALLAWASRDGDIRVAEIGALVSEVFANKREDVSALIRTRLALDPSKQRVGDPPSMPELFIDEQSDRSLPSSLSPKSASSAASFTPHGVVQTMGSSARPSAVPVAPALASSSKKTTTLLVAGLLVSLALAGGLAGILVSSSRSAPARAVAPEPPPEGKALEPKPAEARGAPAAVTASADRLPGERNVEGQATADAATKETAPTKLAVAPPAPAAPPPAAQRWNHAPAPAPATPPEVREVRPAPAATSAESEQGFLTIDTYPWTRVSEGGRLLGNTPLVRLPMSAGTHVLTLENPQDNVRQTTTVIVKPGETVSKRLAF